MKDFFMNKSTRQRLARLEKDNLEIGRMLERYEESIFSDCLDGQDVFGDIPRINDNIDHIPESDVAGKMASFKTKYCAVAVIRVEDESKSLFDERQRALSEGDGGNYLRDRFRAALDGVCATLFLRKERNLVMLMDFHVEPEDERKSLEDAARIIENEVCQLEIDTGLLLFVTVSRIFDGLDHLSDAYTEAMELTRYTDLFSERTPVFTLLDFQGISHEALASLPPTKVLSAFAAKLAAGDYDSACEMMLMMVTNYAMVDLRHCGHIRFYAEFLFSLSDALCHPSRAEAIPSWHAGEKETDKFSSIEAIQNDIIDYFTGLAEGRTPIENSTKTGKIVQYINENYQNPELDVSALGREFDLSLSHLSRTFKRDMGTNPLDYIHKTRVEASKELLLDRTLTLSQVARQVGYLSAWTLTRVFKKTENMTPGQYRDAFSTKKEG